VLGKYIISDTPMTPEQWARERADVIDAEPADNAIISPSLAQTPKKPAHLGKISFSEPAYEYP
jgi:hypothetical protein